MNNELFKWFGSIGLKTDEAESGMSGIINKAEDTGNKLVSTFKKAAVAIGTAFAIDKIIDLGKVSVAAAAEAEEFAGAFEQVFKGFESEAEKSMQNVTDTIKASEGRFKESFLQISGFGKASGMDTAEAIELSNRAVIAAADYAAMYGGTLENTTESLQSFLKGNFANDAALGVSATEFTRNAKAVELYGQEFNELTETQKQWTLLAMVEEANEQSGAMGQAAREADSYANTMGELKNAWNEFLIIVGGPILKAVVPVIKSITQGVQWLTEAIVPAAEAVGKFFEGFKSSSSEIRKAINREFKQLMQWLDGFVSIFKEIDFELLLENLIEFGQGAIEVFMEIAEDVLEFLEPIKTYWENTFDTIQTLFKGLVRAFNQAMRGDWSGAFSTLKTAIGDALISMGDNILTAWAGIWGNVKSFVTSIDWGATAQSVMTLLGNAIYGAVTFLGDIAGMIKSWIQDKLDLDDGSGWGDIGKAILGLITTGITSAISGVSNIGSQIITWIFNSLGATGDTDWQKVGESILLGIFNTISSLASSLTQIAVALIQGINDMMTAEQFHDLVNTMLDMIVVTILAIAGGLGAVATALVNGIALGLLGADNWGDVVTNISTKINEVLTSNPFEFDWLTWLNLDPSKWDWSNTFWNLIPGFEAPFQEDAEFKRGGGQEGNTSQSSSAAFGKSGGSSSSSAQYDAMAAEATTGMSKVNQAIRQGYDAIRTTFDQMESNMVKLMTQIMTKVTEPVGPGMREVNQEFRSGYEPIRVTFTQMGTNLERLMKEAITKVEAAVNANMAKVVTAFRSRISAVETAGADTGRGFYNGLNSQRSRIINLANDIATSVLSTMTRALDINSPSGETEWIADMTIEGLYGRLKAGISRIKEITGEVASAMLFEPQDVDLSFAYGQTQSTKPSMTEIMLDEVTQLLKQLRDKDDALYMDGYELGRRGTKYINQENEIRATRNNRLKGGTA